jgi:uncharacterized membrane protein
MSLRRLLLGRRLANREQGARQIGAFEAVPAMGLDGLASAAYGPEAALTILLPVGAAGLAVFGPIIAAIVVLLLILFASYWQTIKAYPSNGGDRVRAGRARPRQRGRRRVVARHTRRPRSDCATNVRRWDRRRGFPRGRASGGVRRVWPASDL